MQEQKTGTIISVAGSVVDVKFDSDSMPILQTALHVKRTEGVLTLEVVQLLENNVARALALDTTDGLYLGQEVINTQAPIMIPVGESTLGRVMNVTGHALDGLGPIQTQDFEPIHKAPPAFTEQATETSLLVTGIKVIDLLCPCKRGKNWFIWWCRCWKNSHYYGIDK